MGSFLFGIHCHQPVDNFSFIVNEAIERAYKPFIGEFLSHADIKIAVHFSGWLLEYIREHNREMFGWLVKLADDGRIEFFSGGYYEPILASIPPEDRVAQIEKLNGFIRNYFGSVPRGLWLTERVYDESIVRDLCLSGIEYVIVDDYHFLSAGFKEEELKGYFVTEDGGYALKVFPISKKLRYMVPFKPEKEVLDTLKTLSDNEAVVLFDDGEKFGVWPGTYNWVYTQMWLKRFFEGLHDVVRSENFGEFVDRCKPLGIAYLPSCSYYEMGQWSLRSDEYYSLEEARMALGGREHLLKGGVWKNFFVKYAESNRLHKRMLELSKKPQKAVDPVFKDNLFRLQCNDVYWHGIFGGLYLPNLRDNAYRFLINCEKRLSRKPVEIADDNLDGYLEAKLRSNKALLVFDEAFCGQMTEFDLLDVGLNLQNTLTRRKEFYHKPRKTRESSSDGIKTIHEMDFNPDEWLDSIHYDWYVKNSFVDHFTDRRIEASSFERCSFPEYGDFANQPSELVSDKPVTFRREGGIYKDGSCWRAALEKLFELEGSRLVFRINFNTEHEEELFYLLEFNLHFFDSEAIFINGVKPSVKRDNSCGFVRIEDGLSKKRIDIVLNRSFDLLTYALNTVSQSERGFSYINQGITLGCGFAFRRGFSIEGYLTVSDMEDEHESV